MLDQYILRIVPAEQREQWDAFVNQHPQGHLLQSWGWGEIKASAGWHPLRLALWDREQQTIVAGAQVLRRTAAHVPLRAGHLAYIPKGPVIDWSQPLLVKTLFSRLHTYVRKQGALALRIELGHPISLPGRLGAFTVPQTWLGDAPTMIRGQIEATIVAQYLSAMHFHAVRAIQPLRTILLDITPDEETLLAHMKEKWRYNVRLAGRKGVTIRVAESVEDVQAWYTLLQTTSERDHFGIHTLDYYLYAWRTFFPRNQARLLLADYQGQLLAGIFVGLLAKQAIYLYGASSNEHRNLMPNYLLQWEAIRWAKQMGATSYDFWGIPETDNEEEAMAGIYRFKAGWGGQVVSLLGCYEHIYRPLAMHLVNKFISV